MRSGGDSSNLLNERCGRGADSVDCSVLTSMWIITPADAKLTGSGECPMERRLAAGQAIRHWRGPGRIRVVWHGNSRAQDGMADVVSAQGDAISRQGSSQMAQGHAGRPPQSLR